MWWDDGWAVIALFADIASLASVILEQPVPGGKIIIELTRGLETHTHGNTLISGRFPYSNIGQWITFCAFPTITWCVFSAYTR